MTPTHAHPPVSLDDKIKELRRELSKRELWYPRWVREGKLKESAASRQLAVLRAILRDYEARALKPGLFDKPDNQEVPR